jgi:hypothetical protein
LQVSARDFEGLYTLTEVQGAKHLPQCSMEQNMWDGEKCDRLWWVA